MSASGSLPVYGDACLDDLITTCANGLDFTTKRSSGGNGGFTCVASVRLGGKGQGMKNRLVCRYSGSAIDPLRALFGPLSKSVHTSSVACFSVGPAHELNGGSQDTPTITSLK